jgi:hypothetical protein
MRQELQDKLLKKYPNLTVEHLHCGDGWYWLIDKLYGAIQACGEKNIEGMVELTNYMSKNICEKCGSIEGCGNECGLEYAGIQGYDPDQPKNLAKCVTVE